MLSIYTPDIKWIYKIRITIFQMRIGQMMQRDKTNRRTKRTNLLNPSRYNENNMDEGWETADEYLSGNVRSKLLALAEKYAEETPGNI
ncbi:MAG: hypothetical protein ACLUEN_00120 [Coprococcus sp.]